MSILIVAAIAVVAVGVITVMCVRAGIAFGRKQEQLEAIAQVEFDTRMDEITGYDARAARAEAYGEPAEVPAVDAAPVEIISFGYGHGPAPQAHAVFDVREHFKDPHVDPNLRYLTAADAVVMYAVLSTPGVGTLVGAIVETAHAFRRGPKPGPVTIAVGCVGGRHRSAAVAIEAARLLENRGIPVVLTHRDMHRPVIERRADGPRRQAEEVGR